MAQLFRKLSANLFRTKSLFHNTKFTLTPTALTLKRNFQTSLALQKLVTFNLSDIGEGIHEVVVKEWFVEVGQVVSQFDNICEVQSDKASVTITSRFDGRIMKLYHSIDAIALVGKPLVDFDVDDEEGEESESSSSSSDSEKESSGSASDDEGGKVMTTPAVRRLAKENNVDLSKVRATGKGKRILKGDVLEYLNMIPKGTQKPHPTLKKEEKNEFEVPPPLTTRTVVSPLVHKIVPLKGVPKVMFKSMTESLKIPHFSYSEEIDMTKLVSVRDEMKIEAQKRGIKITYMPFFIKGLSVCLHKYPILNSSLDVERESIIYKPYHNISIAIHTPMGLVVPNIKNVHEKSILEISNDLMAIHEKGIKGLLTPDDFSDGTFTLSNIGIIGGTYTHPVIMPPQVCIVAIGKINAVPRFDNKGDIVKAHIMNVSFSADHRVIDGVTISSFVNLWKQYLENPNLFLLDGH